MSGKINARKRAADFPNDLYSDNISLFCLQCDIPLSLKLSTIKDHLKCPSHKNNKAKKANKSLPKQTTLITAINSSIQRSDFVKDFVKMCLVANIPLEKTAKMMPFMRKHCKVGGALTTGKNLRDNYVPVVANELRSKIQNLITQWTSQNQIISLNIDESSDEAERSVLNIIVCIRNNFILLDTNFLDDPANHENLAAVTNDAIVKFGIRDATKFLITDNTAYCRKAYEYILVRVFPNLIWIGCWAHIIDLVGDT